jgi:2-polyprenyl-3-methyl-5-hydroxy-6-metoxy-1,4-benzoquinol methylase
METGAEFPALRAVNGAPPDTRPSLSAGTLPPCPVCDSHDTQQAHAAEITSGKEISFSYTFSREHNRTLAVHRCSRCSHQFCSPIPHDIAVNYCDVVDEEYLKHESSRRVAAKALLSRLASHRRSGKLLDIGCATGDFLVEAADYGFDVEGLEPSVWSSSAARKRGLQVHQELLEAFADQHPEQYDVATLWGVIEHFANPVAEVGRIARILKPGGHLALWTGDVDSITSRVLGRRWWYWQGQHIQYFTRKSLELVLSSGGLNVVASHLYPFGASRETLANSLRRYRPHRLLNTLLRPAFLVKPVWFLRIPGEMFVIARKAA